MRTILNCNTMENLPRRSGIVKEVGGTKETPVDRSRGIMDPPDQTFPPPLASRRKIHRFMRPCEAGSRVLPDAAGIRSATARPGARATGSGNGVAHTF